jgi:uncharacterized protein YuzE
MSNTETRDLKADAAYMRFNSGKVRYTLPVDTGILADYDESGRVVGIEVLFVSNKSSVDWDALLTKATGLSQGSISKPVPRTSF